MKLITLAEYLMGRDKAYASEFSKEIAENAQQTTDKVNAFLTRTGFDGHVNSGWRPAAVNAATAGAAPHSKHMDALACDLLDHDGEIDAWCMANQDVLAELGLWLEHPDDTPGWCHLQIVPPHSGNRVFIA